MRTRSNRVKKNHKKTRKLYSVQNRYNQDMIVLTFLEMLNTVKLYHWKTHSYSQHKATDKLYSQLNGNIDTFVETMLGKTGNRINLTKVKSLPLDDFNSLTDFEKKIKQYKDFLINMTNDINLNITNNSDLLNIRDEILGNMNQFSYLLTFE
jgi:DNA-binding ferritin-like protein